MLTVKLYLSLVERLFGQTWEQSVRIICPLRQTEWHSRVWNDVCLANILSDAHLPAGPHKWANKYKICVLGKHFGKRPLHECAHCICLWVFRKDLFPLQCVRKMMIIIMMMVTEKQSIFCDRGAALIGLGSSPFLFVWCWKFKVCCVNCCVIHNKQNRWQAFHKCCQQPSHWLISLRLSANQTLTDYFSLASARVVMLSVSHGQPQLKYPLSELALLIKCFSFSH